MTDLTGYGKFIKRHREDSGYRSQRQLAEVTGISSATLSRIESEIQRPNIDTVRMLSGFLKTTTFSDLMEQCGYFNGLTGEKLRTVKEFFEDNKDVDDSIELYLKQLLCIGEEAAEQAKKKIEEFFEEEVVEYGEINKSLSGILEFLKFAASDIETKEKLLAEIKELIEKHKNSDSFSNEREFISKIDLSDEESLQRTKVIIDGRELTEKELRKFVAIVRLDRQD